MLAACRPTAEPQVDGMAIPAGGDVRRPRSLGVYRDGADDFAHRAAEAYAELGQWLAQGRLTYRVDTVHGLDHAVLAVNRLFEGTNHGKLIVMP